MADEQKPEKPKEEGTALPFVPFETILEPSDPCGPTIKDPERTTDTQAPRTPTNAPSSMGRHVSRSQSQMEMEQAPAEVRPLLAETQRRFLQYVIVTQLGQGGMGSVWKAWDTKLARWVAIKFLTNREEESLRRFQREAQLAARLRHPNICTIYEVNESRGTNFLVMEYIDGPSIGKANLSLRQLVEAFVKIARAMEFAHRADIIHRDIKPGNIMLFKSGEPSVTDFGLAKLLQAESSISVHGSVMGTPAYMPPEQATGRIEEVDARSDIYSLGATLYMLATGHAPFEGENATTILFKVCSADPVPPRKLNPEVPEAVEAIILKALEKEKKNRYATAGEMADDLQRFLDDQPVAAKAPSLAGRLTRRIRHNPWPFAAAATVLAAGLVVGGVVLFRPKPAEPRVIEKTTTKTVKEELSPEVKWRGEFGELKSKLYRNEVRGSSDDLIRKTREILMRMPGSLADETAKWFLDQVNALGEPPAKEDWVNQRAKARDNVNWCAMIGVVLEGRGGPFDAVRQKIAEKSAAFAPIAAYRGKITLKIFLWPYAEVRSLKTGDQWIIRDGKMEGGATAVGDSLNTPLVIEDLDIGDYELVVHNAELGAPRTFQASGQDLQNNGTYLFSGSLSKPESIKLRASP